MNKTLKASSILLLSLAMVACGGNVPSSSSEPSFSSAASIDARTPTEKLEEGLAKAAINQSKIVRSTMNGSFLASPKTIEFGVNANGNQAKITQTRGEKLVSSYLYINEDNEFEAYSYSDGVASWDNLLDESLFGGLSIDNAVLNLDSVSLNGALEGANHLYNIGKQNTNHDLRLSDEDGVVSVSFGHVVHNEWGNSYYYVFMDVSFDDANGIISRLSTKTYSLSTADIIIDDENGTFFILDIDSLNPLTLEYSQEAGVRGAIEMPLSSTKQFYATSFDVSYLGTSVGSSIDLTLGGDQIDGFSIVNILPETVSFGFECLSISIDGKATSNVDGVSKSFGLAITTEGTHEVSISSKKGVVKQFNVNASAPLPTGFSFYAAVYEEQSNWWSTGTLSDSLYLGRSVNIVVNASPVGAAAGYTLTCEKATLVDGQYHNKYEDVTVNFHTFTPTELGEYVFVATSTVDPSISSSFTINVVELPDYATIYKGSFTGINFRGGYVQYVLTFTPAEKGALEGTAKCIERTQSGSVAYTGYYTYSVNGENGLCLFTYTSGDKDFLEPVKATPTERFSLNLTYNQGGWENMKEFLNAKQTEEALKNM